MKLSIVTTLYCSQIYLNEFHSRVLASINMLPEFDGTYEIIFVDDGSPDLSLQGAISLLEKDENVKVIELSKNHGHHRAMMIGLEHSAGDYVFLIDVDLEESPENLVLFWNEMARDKHVDMVYGVQKTKEGKGLKKALSRSFYILFNAFSNVKIPSNELVSRLMKRNYVDALVRYRERDLFIPGIWADTGFNRKDVLTEKHSNGESSYTLSNRLSMAVDAVTSFSTKPLLYVFYTGVLIFLFSSAFVVYLVINKLLFGALVGGWTSILVSLFLIGGIIILSIGVLGLYLSRIFSEVKQRPLSIIRKIHQKGQVS